MLRKAMDVLALFSLEKRELGVLEVADVLGRPKSTVSRWLAAMEQADFLDRDPETARYRLSLRLTALGDVARHTTTLQRSARPPLKWLAERTGETANLTLLIGTEAVNVEVADSPRPVMHVGWVGRRLPVHATASGKVLIAHADAPKRKETVLGCERSSGSPRKRSRVRSCSPRSWSWFARVAMRRCGRSSNQISPPSRHQSATLPESWWRRLRSAARCRDVHAHVSMFRRLMHQRGEISLRADGLSSVVNTRASLTNLSLISLSRVRNPALADALM